MLLVDYVRTLIDVVIGDCIRVDLVSWAVFSCEVATIVTIKVKDDFYRN